MKRLLIEPSGWPCTLKECPPGFFLYEKQLCFKTEYGKAINFQGPYEPDAYNSAGEHFCLLDAEVQPVTDRWEEELDP
jgi:hypothetical protein